MGALCSCSDDDEMVTPPRGRSNITFLIPESTALGDNSYNDAAVAGVLGFMNNTGTPVKFLYPSYELSADSLYRRWLAENADKDSCVLVLSTPEYAQLVKDTPPRLTGQGTRILLYETGEAIDGVSTFTINRYGASFLCGAMACFREAYIFAAMKGLKSLDDAVAGFKAGHEYGCKQEGTYNYEYDVEHYLGTGAESFETPLAAYNYLQEHNPDRYILFPLLGGSNKGVVNYYTLNYYTGGFFIGMDVAQDIQSDLVPYSMVVRIGFLLNYYLQQWKAGQEWAKTASYNLDDDWIRIETTDDFSKNFDYIEVSNQISIMFEQNPDTLTVLRDKYYDTAVEKERAYYGGK